MAGASGSSPNGRNHGCIKQQKYEETSPAELGALDELAALLAAERVEQLAESHWATPALRLEAAERDPHSIVWRCRQGSWHRTDEFGGPAPSDRMTQGTDFLGGEP